LNDIQQRFETFHDANPQVLEALENMTRQWLAVGHAKCSIQMLWERLRWLSGIGVTDWDSAYRLNDHYRSRYVRLLIERNPQWANVFDTRTLRAA
jgi:hypothetical protein